MLMCEISFMFAVRHCSKRNLVRERIFHRPIVGSACVYVKALEMSCDGKITLRKSINGVFHSLFFLALLVSSDFPPPSVVAGERKWKSVDGEESTQCCRGSEMERNIGIIFLLLDDGKEKYWRKLEREVRQSIAMFAI